MSSHEDFSWVLSTWTYCCSDLKEWSMRELEIRMVSFLDWKSNSMRAAFRMLAPNNYLKSIINMLLNSKRNKCPYRRNKNLEDSHKKPWPTLNELRSSFCNIPTDIHSAELSTFCRDHSRQSGKPYLSTLKHTEPINCWRLPPKPSWLNNELSGDKLYRIENKLSKRRGKL